MINIPHFVVIYERNYMLCIHVTLTLIMKPYSILIQHSVTIICNTAYYEHSNIISYISTTEEELKINV